MALLETISVAMLTRLDVAGLMGIIDLSVDLTSRVSILHDQSWAWVKKERSRAF
jgi:hypothetical protein